MLVSQKPLSPSEARHGSLAEIRAELERREVAPSTCDDGLRQRLLVLSQRLARVGAMGNEYAQVVLSEHAQAVLAERAEVA